MIRLIISGGQTGADQAGLRAARAFGIPTGGTAPKGWLTEDGPAPWLAEWGLVECEVKGYPARTAANVRDADATIWFGSTGSRGYAATLRAIKKRNKPSASLPVMDVPVLRTIRWMEFCHVRSLNIAGNRESGNPGIGAQTEAYMRELFRALGHEEREGE